MSGSQKVIKFVSVLTIILAIITIVGGIALGGLGGLAIGGAAADPTLDEDIAYGGVYFMAAAVILIVGAIIDIIVGILGLRGAKDPNKIGAFRVFVVIGLIFAILDLVATFLLGTPDATTIAGDVIRLVLIVILLICANNVAKMRTY